MSSLDFYFDYSSPFAYLAATQIERVAQEKNAAINYKPFLLGALFKDIGTPIVPLFSFNAPKQKYYQRDMQLWAQHWGVPLNQPSIFPLNTVKPLRLTLVALEKDPQAARRLISSIYAAFWVNGKDISSEEVLASLLAEANCPEEWLACIATPEIKEALKTATTQAVERGVCGAPSIDVEGYLFWGQDRLDFVSKVLDGWQPKIG